MGNHFSLACSRNQQYILDKLQKLFIKKSHNVLEIGSGTHQHAVYFAQNMPFVTWQPSDLKINHSAEAYWVRQNNLPNINKSIVLDINNSEIPDGLYTDIFMANTCHIMSWDTVKTCIKKAATALPNRGLFIIYGPFNFNGEYTSSSNAEFDNHLKTENSLMGIRDFEDIESNCIEYKLKTKNIISMPANNEL